MNTERQEIIEKVKIEKKNNEDDLAYKVGQRMKSERIRLELSQSDFAELGGLTKQAQINYEAGKRAPDILYLMRIKEKTNIDLNYILTGETGSNEASLNDDETALIDRYRYNKTFQLLCNTAMELVTINIKTSVEESLRELSKSSIF
jgi:transcriptional regulator with XRE-family HTH domain